MAESENDIFTIEELAAYLKISKSTLYKLLQFGNANPFTKDAKERWSKIPKPIQEQILNNVFCAKCLGSVSIALKSAVMNMDDLILKGKCKRCGHKVCRVVEPEN